MPLFFQDFGFVEWWKAIAVILTGIFAFFALTQENKDKKTGKLTKWGKVAIFGIVISSVGGLLAQINESSDQAKAERRHHAEIISILSDQARLLRPLKIDKVYGEFRVPCEGAYAGFCEAVRAFRKVNPVGIMPINVFDAFPGGRTEIIVVSIRFFANETDAKAQLNAYDDQKSKYSAYMQLPLIAGNDNKCGMRVNAFPPNDEIRLFIYQSCPFLAVNSFGGLKSHLDLNGLEFSGQIGPPIPGLPALEPDLIGLIFADAERSEIRNFSRFQGAMGTIFVTKFTANKPPV